MSALDRIRLKIKVNDSGCHEWTGALSRAGYARMHFAGRNSSVTRLYWSLVNGPFDPALDVCHRCDNRKCVNLDHLFLGTRQQNMDDMAAKGRSGRRKTKITQQQANEIRASPATYRALCAQFGLSMKTVWDIRHGLLWNRPGEKS